MPGVGLISEEYSFAGMSEIICDCRCLIGESLLIVDLGLFIADGRRQRVAPSITDRQSTINN